MTYDLEELKTMIPMYINGSMPEEQRAEFERQVKNNTDLAKELQFFSTVQAVIEDDMPDFDRLQRRVEQRIDVGSKQTGLGEWLRNTKASLQHWLAMPAVSWGAVAAQFLVIVVLVGQIQGQQEPAVYETLSGNAGLPQQATGERVNIVFVSDASMKAVAELLDTVQASAVSGPSVSGHMLVRLPPDAEVEEKLASLRQSKIVTLAEVAY